MKLSDGPGKCALILFTKNLKDEASDDRLNGEKLVSVKQTKLLRVTLDQRLTMKPQCLKMEKEGKSRISQLWCVANSCFGPS